MNPVFLVLVAAAVITAALTGEMERLQGAIFDSAKSAVDVAFGLIGPMVLFLGMIQVLRDAGAVGAVARGLAPVMRRLFPDVPPDHPAMGAMIMNVAANVFGLGNAATPFGLKAMQELNRLNPHPGVATNAMVLFLAINTSGVAVFPSGVIAIRDSLGSDDPGGIVLPTLLATMTSTLVGVTVALWLSRRAAFAAERFVQSAAAAPAAPSGLATGMVTTQTDALLEEEREAVPAARTFVAWGAGALLGVGVLHAFLNRVLGVDPCAALLAPFSTAPPHVLPETTMAPPDFFTQVLMSQWLIPAFLCFVVLFGWARGVRVYESAIKGAREGFQIFVMILPFLVMILVAVGMFRASGALGAVESLLGPITALIGFPVEALPMALVRPLSGSGAQGVMVATMEAHGPDSLIGYLVSVMSGSTETTFYVLAVYFGSAQIRVVRHAVIACLSADLAGILAALFYTRLFLV